MKVSVSTELATFIYELLDAHEDTAEMVGKLSSQPRWPAHLDVVRWQAHLDYLRALQRKGREVLAELSTEEQPR